MIDFLEIIEKIKEIVKVDKDKELATILNTTPENFSRWKTRNSIPYEQLVYFANEQNINLNWLLSNKGEKYLDNTNLQNNKIFIINLKNYNDEKEIKNVIKLLEYAPKQYLSRIKHNLEKIKDMTKE